MTRSVLSLLAIASLLVGAPPGLSAPSYPSGAITLVIPLGPGDATDIVGRTMGDELSKLLKVPIVPVNRPGGGMTIGTDSVVKAKKDGYTLLLTPNAGVVTSRVLNPETVSYDPVKDLTPLGLAARTPILFAIRPDAPFKSLREMVEFSKKNPDKVRVGTAGAGTVGHLDLEMINSLTGAGLTPVPFKGGPPGITALLGGHVEAVALTVGALNSHLRSGAMKGIVVSNKSPQFPEIPTMAELGYRQNLLGAWMAFYAPAGVPAEVTKALVPAIEKVARDPALAAKLAGFGIVLEYAPPEKVLADIREETRTVEEIARKAGLIK